MSFISSINATSVQNSDVNICIICLEEMAEITERIETVCHHTFHESCFIPWIQSNHNTCPLCRNVLITSNQQQANQVNVQATLHSGIQMQLVIPNLPRMERQFPGEEIY